MNDLVCFALAAFFPAEGDLPGLGELGLNDKVAALRRDATPLFWFGMVAAAFFFQISPILTIYRPWPAVWLDEEQLDRHAFRLATHRSYLIRQIVMLLKLVGGMYWGQSAPVRAMLTLPPYPEDPGTRRTGMVSEAPALPERAPVPPLVQIGRKEELRGRGREHDRAHALDVEAL